MATLEPGDGRVHRCHIQGHQHFAAGVDALGHRQTQITRHQGLRLLHLDVVLLEAVLVGHLHGIAKALGHHQRRARTFALDDGIGGQGRAVNDHVHGVRLHSGGFQYPRDPRHDALFRRRLGGEHLVGDVLLTDGERYIGKGAADVDSEPDGGITQDGLPLSCERRHPHQLQNGHTWYQWRHLKRSSHWRSWAPNCFACRSTRLAIRTTLGLLL